MPSLFSALQAVLKRWFGAPSRQSMSADAPALEISANDLQNTSMQAEEYTQHPSQIVPYDENLLERSRTQWQFGDWESLAQLSRDTLQHHPDRAKLALLAAAGLLQQGETDAARQFVRLAQDWGCNKKLISQILVAGVHNSLGRVGAILGQTDRALAHFATSIKTGSPSTDSCLTSKARAILQIEQLGIPPVEIEYHNNYWVEQREIGHRNIRRNFKARSSSSPFSGVVITGDLLRPSWDGKLSQNHNINWLYSILSTQISCAFASPPRKRHPIRLLQGDLIQAKSVYETAGEVFSEDGWAKLYLQLPSDVIIQSLTKLYDVSNNELVVSFELPPIIKHYFDAKNITYIDIRIGQYRFFDDIPLVFSTNDSLIAEALGKYRMTKEIIEWHTSCEKLKRSKSTVMIDDNSLVFFGQTSKDASLIVPDGFDSYKNYTDTIVQTVELYSNCYYKHHPSEASEEAADFFKQAGFLITDDNTYDLLCSDRLSCVMGITTTVMQEASLFGKKINRLGRSNVYDGTALIYDAFLSSDFWASIMNINSTHVSFAAPSQPNLIRSTIGVAWGK